MTIDQIASTSRIPNGAYPGHVPAMARPASTRETLDFIGSELEILEKTLVDHAQKLDLFLDPDHPDASCSLNEPPDNASELICRLRSMNRQIIRVRQRIERLTERAN